MSSERNRLADALDRVLAGTLDLNEIFEQEALYGEPLSHCYHGLQHYLGDADIRKREPEYRAMQEKEMRKLIRLLHSDVGLEFLDSILFLG
jgi:hypothetical protein